MTTYWRDTASQTTQDQLDTLLGTALLDAERIVRKHGEFYPFAIVWPTGAEEPETVMVADELTPDGLADSQVIIDRTLAVLETRSPELDAVAFVTDVFVAGSSAVSVALEHRDGVALGILQYYGPKKLGRGFKMGQLAGHAAEPRIWPAS